MHQKLSVLMQRLRLHLKSFVRQQVHLTKQLQEAKGGEGLAKLHSRLQNRQVNARLQWHARQWMTQQSRSFQGGDLDGGIPEEVLMGSSMTRAVLLLSQCHACLILRKQ